MPSLSKQLRSWRGVTGPPGKGARGSFSQDEAAERLGVPVRTYQDWEQGRKEPRGLALETINQRLQDLLSKTKKAPGRASKVTIKRSAPPASGLPGKQKVTHARKKTKAKK